MSEKFRDRAGSIVSVIVPNGNAYHVLEDPAAIREKMAELREAISLGLGTGEDEQTTGMLKLTGIDLICESEVHTQLYPLDLNPATIAVIRGVTDALWESEIEGAEQNAKRRANAQAQEAAMEMGLPPGFQILNLGAALAGQAPQGPPRSEEEVVPKGTEPAFTNKTDPLTECCCGHVAGNHSMSGEGEQTYFHSCEICDCGLFHTHHDDEGHSEH